MLIMLLYSCLILSKKKDDWQGTTWPAFINLISLIACSLWKHARTKQGILKYGEALDRLS